MRYDMDTIKRKIEDKGFGYFFRSYTSPQNLPPQLEDLAIEYNKICDKISKVIGVDY